ncbi:hypothetical protein EDD86DRAFT_19547 [Gorgonomyces haynaldii]|nr:hypothetical protein EDD86DRAFT_19547 [Gorgonomyces haynaldii]
MRKRWRILLALVIVYLLWPSKSRIRPFRRTPWIPLSNDLYQHMDTQTILQIPSKQGVRIQTQFKDMDCPVSWCEFTNDQGDAYLTSEQNLVIQNPPLHFTKIVIDGDPSKPWHGTDVYVSLEQMQSFDNTFQLFSPPLHIPVIESEETYQSLMQPVSFESKSNLVAIFAPECSLIQDLVKNLPFGYYTYPHTCFGSRTDCQTPECVLKRTRASIVFGEDRFLTIYFLKSIAYGNIIFYYASISLRGYHEPEMAHKLSQPTLSWMDLRQLKKSMTQSHVFDYKQSVLPQSLQSTVNHSRSMLGCHICENVLKRKQSVQTLLSVFETTEFPISIQEGPIQAVFVPHYSKAKDRRIFMQHLEQCFSPNFITQFDKEDLPKSILNLGQHLKPGELSLTVKNYFAYYLLLKHNLQTIMIIEDDAQLARNVKCTAPVDLMDYLPSSYSIAHLGGCNSAYNYGYFNNPYGLLDLTHHQVYCGLENHEHCTTSYLISKQGALLMFKSLPFKGPIDLQMVGGGRGGMFHPDFSAYSIWPPFYLPSLEINSKSDTGIRS